MEEQYKIEPVEYEIYDDLISVCLECQAYRPKPLEQNADENLGWSSVNDINPQRRKEKVLTLYSKVKKLSHGYCPPCAKKTLEALEEELRK